MIVVSLTLAVGPICCFSVMWVVVVAHLIMFFGAHLRNLVLFTRVVLS